MAKKPAQPKRVKCYGCKKPIHIDRWAGAAKTKRGKVVFFCDALPCLLLTADMVPYDEPIQE